LLHITKISSLEGGPCVSRGRMSGFSENYYKQRFFYAIQKDENNQMGSIVIYVIGKPPYNFKN
jgi:hypothetical protein